MQLKFCLCITVQLYQNTVLLRCNFTLARSTLVCASEYLPQWRRWLYAIYMHSTATDMDSYQNHSTTLLPTNYKNTQSCEHWLPQKNTD